MKEKIEKIIATALAQTFRTVSPQQLEELKKKTVVEESRRVSQGDYSTNLPLLLAQTAGSSPLAWGEKIKAEIEKEDKQTLFEQVVIAHPGFINFFLSPSVLTTAVKDVLKEKEHYGDSNEGADKQIQIEFVSANPTGPLTLGNGRGGFYGDSLANIFDSGGYAVVREYYVNDVGEQVRQLGHSLIGDEQAVYKGDYIGTIRERLGTAIKKDSPETIGVKGAEIIIEEIIKPTLERMQINFNNFFSEKSLYKNQAVDKTIDYLREQGLVYKQAGAVWFQSTRFGDDKDRVLIRADKEKTYFASDIAYLKNKLERGFDKIIYIWGADHHGYIKRMQAAAQALGCSQEEVENKIKIIIVQLIDFLQDGKKFRMSKRKGTYVTLSELLDEVPLDVARFFFLERGPDSHLVFDIALAKEKSEKNPVYYVQYAHARIAGILEKAQAQKLACQPESITLEHPAALQLAKLLIQLPDLLKKTREDYQLQRLTEYSKQLAAQFHRFYRDCRIIGEEKKLAQSRLALAQATAVVLKKTLNLMGIEAPEKM